MKWASEANKLGFLKFLTEKWNCSEQDVKWILKTHNNIQWHSITDNMIQAYSKNPDFLVITKRGRKGGRKGGRYDN